MIYSDLDGVLRNLAEACFGKHPPSWNTEDKQGRGLVEIIRDNPDILITAKAFPYLAVVKKYGLIILSVPSAVPGWEFLTYRWMGRNRLFQRVNWHKDGQDKLAYMMPEDVLIDDNPKIAGDKRVWLIDRPYNRHVVPASGVRIKTARQLEGLIKKEQA